MTETGVWEYALPDGRYTVVAAAGDTTNANNDSTHRVVAEGVPVIDGYNGLTPVAFEQGIAEVVVTDGKLTVTPAGGKNTKLSFIEIYQLELFGPAAPTDLTATLAADEESVELAWEPVADAIGYNVYRSDVSPVDIAATPLNAAPLTATSFEDSIDRRRRDAPLRRRRSRGRNAAFGAVERADRHRARRRRRACRADWRDPRLRTATASPSPGLRLKAPPVTRSSAAPTSAVPTGGAPISGEPRRSPRYPSTTPAQCRNPLLLCRRSQLAPRTCSQRRLPRSTSGSCRSWCPGTCAPAEWSTTYFDGRRPAGRADRIRVPRRTRLQNYTASEEPAAGVGTQRLLGAVHPDDRQRRGNIHVLGASRRRPSSDHRWHTVFDAWQNANAVTSTFSAHLAAGPHNIVVEYYQAGGNAKPSAGLHLRWRHVHGG